MGTNVVKYGAALAGILVEHGPQSSSKNPSRADGAVARGRAYLAMKSLLCTFRVSHVAQPLPPQVLYVCISGAFHHCNSLEKEGKRAHFIAHLLKSKPTEFKENV